MSNLKFPAQVTNLQNILRKAILKRVEDFSASSIDLLKISNSLKTSNFINVLNESKKKNLINLFQSEIDFSSQIIKENKHYHDLFNQIKANFDNFCKNMYLNNNFKFVYINYERYNYSLVEYICLYNNNTKGLKFSVLDFCTAVNIFIPHFCYHPDLSIAVIVECA